MVVVCFVDVNSFGDIGIQFDNIVLYDDVDFFGQNNCVVVVICGFDDVVEIDGVDCVSFVLVLKCCVFIVIVIFMVQLFNQLEGECFGFWVQVEFEDWIIFWIEIWFFYVIYISD